MKLAKKYEILFNSSTDFELSDFSMLTLIGGTKKVDNSYRSYLQDDIPNELLKHRYLMHPIRLTIMKLLNYENKMISSDIRFHLGVTWGEYRTHLKSLEEKGYISIFDEFNVEGSVIQVVCIEETARLEFQTLFELLQQFTANLSPYNDLSSKDLYHHTDKNLYPN